MTQTPPTAPADLPAWAEEHGIEPEHYRAAQRIRGRVFGWYEWQDQDDRAACMVVEIIGALQEAGEASAGDAHAIDGEPAPARRAGRAAAFAEAADIADSYATVEGVAQKVAAAIRKLAAAER